MICIRDAPEPKCPFASRLPGGGNTVWDGGAGTQRRCLGPRRIPLQAGDVSPRFSGSAWRRVLKRQSVQKKFVDYCWRWHQIFQFQVENALQALRAKRAKFGELPQEFGQIVGAIQPPVIESHMVFETIYNLVLEFFHPLGFFKPVPLCKREGRGR